jgi:glycosyltransferase involved in cell wall biosynthesis
MASVIRVLTEHRVGGETVDFHPTWTPRSRLAGARFAASAAMALVQMPAGETAHIHLSERGSFLREGALLVLARMLGLVTVATIHGAEFTSFAHRNRWLVCKVLERAHLITCLDQGALEVLRRDVPRVPSEIVPNPAVIDADPLPASETGELVVFAGEIGLRKGADVLYRAWQLVAQRRSQARCLMVGPKGDFAPPHAERLEVRSPVSPEEITEILRRARVVALPARAEGMPMVLIETMSVARPFVGSPVGGIPELAEAGGILVPVGDADSLADRLTELLADPNLARKIGERGRQFCLETRSIEVLDARLRELYAQAAAAR